MASFLELTCARALRRRASYGYNLNGTQSKPSVWLGKFNGELAGFGRFEGHLFSGRALPDIF
jgi:hypothetical protein